MSHYQECIDTWLERSKKCPVCLHEVELPPLPDHQGPATKVVFSERPTSVSDLLSLLERATGPFCGVGYTLTSELERDAGLR